MTINTGLHIFMLSMMIVGSIVAVFSKKLISSLVSLGAVGMLLSIYFLILSAPDIAITQLVVEILALIILLSAITGRDVTADMTSSKVYAFLFLFIFLISIFTFISSSYFIFPEFGNSNMKVSEKYLYLAPTKLKSANVVTAIVLDFRGYDTIGEATVIFTAIIGVMVLLRKKGKKDEKGMSEIVKTVSKIVCPFILVFGISIIFYGHLTPGGGFPGGVVISTCFVILLLAYGKEKALSKLSLIKSDILHDIGAILFLSVALIGFLSGIFFLNIFDKGKLFSLWSGGNLLFSNIAIGIKVGTSLFLGITLLSMARIVYKGKKIEFYEEKEDIK